MLSAIGFAPDFSRSFVPAPSAQAAPRPLLENDRLGRALRFAIFDLTPFSKCFGRPEIAGSIALPDRIHRFISLVPDDPRHHFALRDDTETEPLRGPRPFAGSLVSQGGWNDD